MRPPSQRAAYRHASRQAQQQNRIRRVVPAKHAQQFEQAFYVELVALADRQRLEANVMVAVASWRGSAAEILHDLVAFTPDAETSDLGRIEWPGHRTSLNELQAD